MAKLEITLDGVQVREVVLDKDHISLGRRPYNHVVVDNLAVSGDHAVFQYVDGQFFVEDLNSTNGTSVNGIKVKRQSLSDGDVVGIARYKIRFSNPPGEVSPTPKTTGVLQTSIHVISGSSAGRSLMLTKPITTLGKPGMAVASITRRAENFVLRYIEGTRPLVCNGNVLAAREHILVDGDLFSLAGVEMRFQQQTGDDDAT